MQVLLIIALLAVAIFLLSVGVVFRKDGKFRSQDIGQSEAMRSKGIHCYRTQDKLAQADKSKITDMMK